MIFILSFHQKELPAVLQSQLLLLLSLNDLPSAENSFTSPLFPFSGAFMKVMNSCSKASCGAPLIIAFHSYFSFLLFISSLLILLFPVSLQTSGFLLVHDVNLLLNSRFHDSPSSFWHANPCKLCSLSPNKSSRTICEHWLPSSQALGRSI